MMPLLPVTHPAPAPPVAARRGARSPALLPGRVLRPHLACYTAGCCPVLPAVLITCAPIRRNLH